MFYVPFMRPRNKVQAEPRSLARVASQERRSPGPRLEHRLDCRARVGANATSLVEMRTG